MPIAKKTPVDANVNVATDVSDTETDVSVSEPSLSISELFVSVSKTKKDSFLYAKRIFQ